MDNLISVIIPAYNVENLLERCVNSILQQTYQNIEIIIVDDGAKDKTGIIADRIMESNSAKIQVIHQENMGLSGARNTGIDYAQGEYISFIDSDDYIESGMIEEMLKAMKSTDSDISVCGRIDEYPNRKIERFNFDGITELSPDQTMRRILLWDKIDIAACDKIYKRNLWDGIRFPLGCNNEDICTIPLVIRKTRKVVHVGKSFYHYCHRENSITTSFSIKKITDFTHAIHMMNSYVEKYYNNLHDEIIYFNNHSYLNILIMCNEIKYYGKEKHEAKKYLSDNWNNRFSIRYMKKKDRILKLAINLHLYCLLKKIKAVLKISLRKN